MDLVALQPLLAQSITWQVLLRVRKSSKEALKHCVVSLLSSDLISLAGLHVVRRVLHSKG